MDECAYECVRASARVPVSGWPSDPRPRTPRPGQDGSDGGTEREGKGRKVPKVLGVHFPLLPHLYLGEESSSGSSWTGEHRVLRGEPWGHPREVALKGSFSLREKSTLNFSEADSLLRGACPLGWECPRSKWSWGGGGGGWDSTEYIICALPQFEHPHLQSEPHPTQSWSPTLTTIQVH